MLPRYTKAHGCQYGMKQFVVLCNTIDIVAFRHVLGPHIIWIKISHYLKWISYKTIILWMTGDFLVNQRGPTSCYKVQVLNKPPFLTLLLHHHCQIRAGFCFVLIVSNQLCRRRCCLWFSLPTVASRIYSATGTRLSLPQFYYLFHTNFSPK